MVKIVTDSTSDISPELAKELGIIVVPYTVQFGTENYRDRVDLTPEEFYSKLEKSRDFPTTGAPGPGLFAEAYDKFAEETDEVLGILISSRLSAGYESAVEGKELRRRKECRVEVIDSLFVLAAQALFVMSAVKEAEGGANLDQMVQMVKGWIPKTHLRICLDTLKYLHKGGRIGTAQAFMGSLLRIHPIIGIIDGVVEGVARERSRAKGVDWLYNFVKGFSDIRGLAVQYSTTLDEAEALAQRLSSVFPRERIYISAFGPVVGAHLGPRALGVALIEG